MVYSPQPLELVYGGMATWELVLCPQRVDTMTVISFLVSGGRFGEALCVSARGENKVSQFYSWHENLLQIISDKQQTVWPLRPDVWEMLFYKETMETLSCWATGRER